MKLYSGPLSLFTAKVRIALDEKGLAVERIEVGWSPRDRYRPHHPDVVRLNPKRQVPVLVDGDVVVWDSTLILEYLEERAPDPPLYPSGAAARARCRQLEAAADEIWFPQVWALIDGVFYPAPEVEGAEARVAGAHAEIARLHRGLDEALGDRGHLCGAFGVADIATFVMVATAARLGAPPAPELGRLGAWLARVAARPSVARDMAAMNAVVAALPGVAEVPGNGSGASPLA